MTIREPARVSIAVLLGYIFLTVVMTMPLIVRLGTHIPAAEGSDVWVHEWTFWWIERALLHWQNPFFTNLLFHPTGVSLTTHNIAWFNIGLWFPLQAALGNTVAYSLTYILVFTLNAFCMYLLVFAWTRVRAAAIVGGLIYAFWPYTFTQSGHPNMATIMWLPLVLFYLKRVFEDGKRRDILLAGLFIALTGIARWQLLLVATLMIGLYLLYLLVSQAKATGPAGEFISTRIKLVMRLASPFLFAALLMLPLGGPVVYTQLTQDFPDEVLVHEPWFGSPLLTYLLPNRNLALYQGLVDKLPMGLQFDHKRVDFLGYSVLFLALIGLIGRWRDTLFWFVTALVYWMLALGPELTLAHESLPDFPMPYQYVEDLSLIRIVRRPHRFNAFVALPLGLMAGYGVTILLSKRWFNRHRGLLMALICLLVLAEYRPAAYGLESTAIPRWYTQLANDSEQYAIFGLPPSPRLADKYFMHYQILHHKPMVEGHISRPTSSTFAFMDQSAFLWHLRIHREMKPELVDVSHQLELLVTANVRYLILHKYLLTEAQLEQFVDWLTYEPMYEDEQVMVYHADPQLGRDFEVSDWLDDEIGLIRRSYEPEELSQGELLRIDARWGSRAQPARDLDACIALLDENEVPIQRDCFQIGGTWPTSAWRADEVARGDYALRIDPLLAPGQYSLALDLVAAGSDDASEAVAQRFLGTVSVVERKRSFTEPASAHPAGITFGEQIRLHGFDAMPQQDRVIVTLHWQALQRMERSYKVFLLALDASNGQLLAQQDFIPRQWTYPTTWWETGEYVEETVDLIFEADHSGEVRILVGFYDEETMERLPALDANGDRFVDDAAILAELHRNSLRE